MELQSQLPELRHKTIVLHDTSGDDLKRLGSLNSVNDLLQQPVNAATGRSTRGKSAPSWLQSYETQESLAGNSESDDSFSVSENVSKLRSLHFLKRCVILRDS